MAEHDLFARALAAAQIPSDDGTLKNAYITFDGDNSLRPPDSIENPYGIRPTYTFPAALLHADLEPVGTLLYANVEVGRTLNGRSSPTIPPSAPASNVVAKYARGVALLVDAGSSVRADNFTWVEVVKVDGQKPAGAVWVAMELLSPARP